MKKEITFIIILFFVLIGMHGIISGATVPTIIGGNMGYMYNSSQNISDDYNLYKTDSAVLRIRTPEAESNCIYWTSESSARSFEG